MKVAVASDDGRTIASHFGRVRGFVICEVDEGRITDQQYRPNTFTGHARTGAGVTLPVDRHGPILEALADCAVVVAGGMGQRIRDDLARTGIKVFVTDEGDVETAVRHLMAGALANRPGPSCDHQHGHEDGCGR